MGSQPGRNVADIWSEITETEEKQQPPPQIAVIYRRRRAEGTSKDVDTFQSNLDNGNRMSFAAAYKRVSWNRSLSTRGRKSIAIAAWAECLPQQRKSKRTTKPAIPKGKSVKPLNFDKERAYFQEVDSFELLEESPSPKNFGTWRTDQSENIALPHLSTVLQKWLMSKKLSYSCGLSGSLSKSLENPEMSTESIFRDGFDTSSVKTPEKFHKQIRSLQDRFNLNLTDNNVLERPMCSQKRNNETLITANEDHDNIEVAVRKLSLASCCNPFSALLTVCGQGAPSKLLDILSKYSEPEDIIKIGEGTYGEAFKVGKFVCKIVPIDGDFQVNGAEQKKSEELLEEVILSRTLNLLGGHADHVYNACTTFIETVDLRVCQGPYDATLIRAWEEWDGKNGSENDHPKEFPENQCYVVFVLEHGGQDLESFVLFNCDEARSLLIQVTAGLAVAEAAFEFEHRDLHWGNILISRNESETLQFTLEGRNIVVKTFGLSISIIDFTLSRINTGEDILYLDLSLDQELFEVRKGDIQSVTYRKMQKLTGDCWEDSFPKTNVLWLQYLVDILLLKKSYSRDPKDDRDLRSLKKRLNSYDSAKEAITDPFFSDLFVDEGKGT